MAMPKAVRLLAAVTAAIFIWLFVQIFRNPGSAATPSKDAHKWDEMIRDPNLDREFFVVIRRPL